MSTDESVFVEGLTDDPDPLLHEEAVETRYGGYVDDDGNLTITDERNPANAWIESTEHMTRDEIRALRGGE